MAPQADLELAFSKTKVSKLKLKRVFDVVAFFQEAAFGLHQSHLLQKWRLSVQPKDSFVYFFAPKQELAALDWAVIDTLTCIATICKNREYFQ